MEEGGRIRRGYFVEGLGGAQFALPGAVERLRGADHGDDERSMEATAIAATDPANPFGIALPWPVRGPQRAAGAFVVIVDGRGVLYLEKGGKTLTDLTLGDGSAEPPDDRDDLFAASAQALADLVDHGRFRRLALSKYPDELEPHLTAAGFTPSPKGLTRYGPTT
jgi:ATP-dependent Lhr-like helicase